MSWKKESFGCRCSRSRGLRIVEEVVDVVEVDVPFRSRSSRSRVVEEVVEVEPQHHRLRCRGGLGGVADGGRRILVGGPHTDEDLGRQQQTRELRT